MHGRVVVGHHLTQVKLNACGGLIELAVRCKALLDSPKHNEKQPIESVFQASRLRTGGRRSRQDLPKARSGVFKILLGSSHHFGTNYVLRHPFLEKFASEMHSGGKQVSSHESIESALNGNRTNCFAGSVL